MNENHKERYKQIECNQKRDEHFFINKQVPADKLRCNRNLTTKVSQRHLRAKKGLACVKEITMRPQRK